jgi:hypothetical protein
MTHPECGPLSAAPRFINEPQTDYETKICDFYFQARYGPTI